MDLSISGGVFFINPYFQIALTGAFSAGCYFYWVYLMVLFLFFNSYVHKKIFPRVVKL